jgi:hypothetical protein
METEQLLVGVKILGASLLLMIDDALDDDAARVVCR